MRPHALALAVALALPLAVACKARDAEPAPAATPAPATTPATPTPTPAAPVDGRPRFPLVIQFYSPGGGIDRAAVAALDRHLAGLPTPPEVVRAGWGEEGEVDYCFALPSLTPAERKAFIDGARGAIAASTQVNVLLDHPCHDPAPSVPRDPPPAAAPAPGAFGLVVSFYSPGDGTDGDAIAAFEAYLAKAKGDLELEKIGWGHEGEIDYCLKLSKLTPAERAAFVDGARKAVGGSKKVHVYPDAPCSNKR